MTELSTFISDLALILGTASIVNLLFKKLNQPLVLGYIAAGFLVGPNTAFFPSVINEASVQLWAEIGVIFLLFGLGLEFSFKKLIRVGGSASFAAFVEVSIMIILGYLLGKGLGWSNMDSIFLGGIISISSTSIIFRVIEDLGLKNLKFAQSVFGIVIIEDLVAVVLIVILTAMALTRDFVGLEMIRSVASLAFFLALWFVAGIFILPTILKKISHFLSDETSLIVATGLCFSMVVLAHKSGFSSAFGAFIMGSVLAETVEGERIQRLINPLKNLFSAVFFVSVGMIVQPDVLLLFWKEILAISALVIVGKTMGVTIGSVLSGQNLKSSLQSGLTMSQIGEFSFIIAAVGLQFKVISENVYPIAVSVSILTCFTTPYLLLSSQSIYQSIEKILPLRIVQALDSYSVFSSAMAGNHEWSSQLKKFILKVFLNSIVLVAVSLFMSKIFSPFLVGQNFDPNMAKVVSLSLTLILGAPFFWAIAFGKAKELDAMMRPNDKGSQRLIFLIARILFSLALMGAIIAQFVSLFWAVMITLWVITFVGFFISKNLGFIYQWLEGQFLENLNNENSKNTQKGLNKFLAPWDVHFTEFTVIPESEIVGKPLSELGIREKFGVTIALIERGKIRILAPDRHQVLMPNDIIHTLGTDEQLITFKKFIESSGEPSLRAKFSGDYVLGKIYITENSNYLNKSIREAKIREATNGLIVGIERDGKRILNPDSSERILEKDLLWVVGDRTLIGNL
jgi:CPA2 family monovalent cation:H+ antiporter-2